MPRVFLLRLESLLTKSQRHHLERSLEAIHHIWWVFCKPQTISKQYKNSIQTNEIQKVRTKYGEIMPDQSLNRLSLMYRFADLWQCYDNKMFCCITSYTHWIQKHLKLHITLNGTASLIKDKIHDLSCYIKIENKKASTS